MRIYIYHVHFLLSNDVTTLDANASNKTHRAFVTRISETPKDDMRV